MKAKAQYKAKGEELPNRDSATLIFGLGMTAVFLTMLILNAIA